MDNTGIFVIRSSRISSGRLGEGEDDDDRAAEDDEIDRCGEQIEQTRGGGRPLGDDDGSVSLEEELSSGMAVVRDLGAFVTLEMDLRGELRQDAAIPILPIDVTKDGDGKGVVGLGDTTDGSGNLCSTLGEYLSSLLEMPDVVGSDAMARFLEREEREEGRLAGSEDEDESSLSSSPIPDFDGRNFADYIFQGVDVLDDETESMISIPRRESFHHHSPESLPPGWWIVWQYLLETSGPPLDFGVFLRNDAGAEDSPEGDHDADDEDVASSPAWECVLQESIGQTSELIRGSYRCEPDHHHHDEDPPTDGTSVRCVLRFSNTASLIRGARLHRLAVRCVPHDAFRAAFEAAGEQARADERVRKSPLLRHILDDSSLERPVRLVVERAMSSSSILVMSPEGRTRRLAEGCHDDCPSRTIDSGTTGPPAVALQSPSSSTGAAEPERDDDTGAEDGDGDDERGGGGDDSSSSARLPGRSSIDDALLGGSSGGVDEEVLAAMKMEIESLRSDVEFLNAERGEWSISEKDMREGLSRSTKLLDEERERNARCQVELEERTRETLELRSEVDFLRGQVPTEVEIERAEKDLLDARSETGRAHDMIDMLRAQLSELKRENEKLSAELREHRDSASDALLNATAEADEARMMQRILEGKVREMERLLVCSRSGASSVAVSTAASSGVVAPGRDRGNGNGNGNGGKYGGNGVIVTEATNGTNAGGDFAAAQRSTREVAVEGEESSGSNGDVGSRRDPQGSSTAVDRSFVHPDPRINDQLVGLRERHGKLLAIMSRSDPESRRRNAELIGKIEDAIEAIISSASSERDVG